MNNNQDTEYLVYLYKGEIKVKKGTFYTTMAGSLSFHPYGSCKNTYQTKCPIEYMVVATNNKVRVKDEGDIEKAKEMLREKMKNQKREQKYVKVIRCKECKYFEYDSVAKVDGIPIIVAHEICKKWGDGCKTSEDGYCFLFESQESEERV